MTREADPIDQSSENQALLEAAKIEEVRRMAQRPIPTSLTCWHCAAPTENGARWCDALCRDKWELGRRT